MRTCYCYCYCRDETRESRRGVYVVSAYTVDREGNARRGRVATALKKNRNLLGNSTPWLAVVQQTLVFAKMCVRIASAG